MAGGGGGVQREQFEALRAEVAGMEEGMAGKWVRGEVRGDEQLGREQDYACALSIHIDVDANVYEGRVEGVRSHGSFFFLLLFFFFFFFFFFFMFI